MVLAYFRMGSPAGTVAIKRSVNGIGIFAAKHRGGSGGCPRQRAENNSPMIIFLMSSLLFPPQPVGMRVMPFVA